MLLWAKVTTSRCCITLNNFDGNSDHELIIQSLVIEVEFIAWSNMIVVSTWPFSGQRLTDIWSQLCQVHSSVLSVRSNVILCGTHWSHLITRRTLFCHIWSRLEEVVVKSDQDSKKRWSRKFWNSVIGAAEGRKFSDWDTFGPLPGLCEKEPKKPNGC